MHNIIGLFLVVLIGSQSSNIYAESEVESLSLELRALLQQEMLAIEEGMMNIIPALIAGDLERVASIAGGIESSLILKQNITKPQKHELHVKLSKSFLLKDQQFHEYAGKLEQFASQGQTELVNFYYSKLLQACVACHSEHARHRFPDLGSESTKKAHHH